MFDGTVRRATTGALASMTLLAGCGLLSDGDAEAEKKMTVGTTSEPGTLDPAVSWDSSWDDIGGGERALDPRTVMRMWELNRKRSW